MASVNSPIRKFIKPILYKVLGMRGYAWFQYLGKLRDIKKRLVEEDEMELLPHFMDKDSTVIDIGANFAYYTVRMAELCSAGQVHAFEPIPETFRICKKIVDHHKLKNVILHQAGVGKYSERKTFEVPLQEIGTHSAGQAHMRGRNNELPDRDMYHPFTGHELIECEVVSLDDKMGEFNRVDFIKIDIEGAELFALQGMQKLLTRFKPVMLIEICPFFLEGFGIKEDQVKRQIADLGYSVFLYQKKKSKMKPIEGNFSDGNYILIHESETAKYRHLIEVSSHVGGREKSYEHAVEQ